MISQIRKCDFCDELSGVQDSTFGKIYGDQPRTRTLFRSNELVAIPSLGQIAEGHVLLLPITHHTAIADLHDVAFEELVGFWRKLIPILTRIYGPCVSFEHGIRPGATGGCGVTHAHLHVVPLGKAVDPLHSFKSRFPWTRLRDLNDLRVATPGMLGYLFYQNSQSEAYVFDTPNLASQYMRKVLSNLLGESNWDWRSAGREPKLIATLNRLSGCFAQYFPAANTVCQ